MRRTRYFLAITALALAAGCAHVVPRDETASRIDRLMVDLHARGLFQGAVVVGRNGQPLYARGFGFADVERAIAFTQDTPTDGASMGKTFTAAAVAALAHEGRIDLDAPVQRYVPEFPHAATRVRHLVAHTAGLPGFGWLDTRFAAGATRTNVSHLAAIAREKPEPDFLPGTRYEYDNVAYDTAATVVERATQKPIGTVFEERFFKPLGMRAFLRPPRLADWPVARTRGYARKDGKFVDNDALEGEAFYGASNVYLSAMDLYRWADGFESTLPAEVVAKGLERATLDDGRPTGLSPLSWYVSAGKSRRYYTGNHNGFYALAHADRQLRVAIAFVSNDTMPAWLQVALARALVAISEGRDVPPLVAPAARAPLEVRTGIYAVEGIGDVGVRRDGRRVLLTVEGVEYMSFRVDPDTRYLPGQDANVRFTAGGDGVDILEWDSVYRVSKGKLRP